MSSANASTFELNCSWFSGTRRPPYACVSPRRKDGFELFPCVVVIAGERVVRARVRRSSIDSPRRSTMSSRCRVRRTLLRLSYRHDAFEYRQVTFEQQQCWWAWSR